MAVEKIGRTKSGRTNQGVDVYWDHYNGEVYVGWAGRTYIGKAGSAGAAMRMAEAWLVNK